MKHFKLLLLLFTLSIFNCSSDDDANETMQNSGTTDSNTTVGIVSETDRFSILNEALDITNLKPILNGNVFTVFAPNNAAFQTYLNINLYDEISDVPVEVLTKLLLNHVVNNEILISEINSNTKGYLATNAEGPLQRPLNLYYNINATNQLNGKANILNNEIVTTTGVIHEIDNVLTLPTVYDMVNADEDLSALFDILQNDTPSTDFEEILNRLVDNNLDGLNPDFTLIAPNNSAINMIDTSIYTESELTNILLHHTVKSDNIIYSRIINEGNITTATIQGEDIDIFLSTTNNVKATITDGSGNTNINILNEGIQTINGIIYISNAVLVPSQI